MIYPDGGSYRRVYAYLPNCYINRVASRPSLGANWADAVGEFVLRFVSALAVAMAFSPLAVDAAVIAPPADASAQAIAPSPGLLGETATVERRGALLFTIDPASLRAILPGELAEAGHPREQAAAVRFKADRGTQDEDGVDHLPEPTTWLMIFFGFFGLAFAVRRPDRGPRTRVRFT